MSTSIAQKSNKGVTIISYSNSVKSKPKRGIKNGFDFFKHVKNVESSISKNNLSIDLTTRFKRVGSPLTFIIPEKISSTTYKTIRSCKITFQSAVRLPQVIKQVHNNDLVLKDGVLYGFEKKWGKLKGSKTPELEKSDITLRQEGNLVVLTNYINNSVGKVYKLTFSSKSKASTWFEEVKSVGVYQEVKSYKKII